MGAKYVMGTFHFTGEEAIEFNDSKTMKELVEYVLEKKNGLIDLHLHTTNSDGMESPDEVIGKAQAVGLSLIAITDHNCFTFTE